MLEWMSARIELFVCGFGVLVAGLLWLSMRGEAKAAGRSNKGSESVTPPPVAVPTFNEAKEVERVKEKLDQVEAKAHREPAPSDDEFNDFLVRMDAKSRRPKP